MSGKVYRTLFLKFIAFVMIVLTFLFFSVCSFATDKKNDREVLQEYGYPQEVVSLLTDSMCEKVVLSIGNNKVSSIEYYDEKAVRGNLVIRKITASLKDKQSGKNIGQSVCIYWEWEDSKPLIRADDKITVNWEKDLLTYSEDSFYAEDYYKNDQKEMWSVSETYNVLSGANQGAVSHCPGLKSFSKYIGGSVLFNLSVADSENENYNSKTNVSYEHIVPLTIIIIPIAIFIVVPIMMIFIRKKKNNTFDKPMSSIEK